MAPSLNSSAGRFRFRDLLPFGPRRHPRPRPYLEMAGIAWENRDNLRYAWRILRHGVCDGCSLGPRGLRDDVIPGVHLCMTRLKLLRMNTIGPVPDERLRSVAELRALSNEPLRRLGRLPYPMIHRAGDPRLHRLSWDEALSIVGETLRDVPGERMGFFATSRGIVNETYYTFQKMARLMGSNHVDLCARLCHAASVSGLKDTLGVPAPTCSLKDLIGSELVVILGSHLSNNQPVTLKYLCYAKRRGTRVIVVNPMREPGLERYWVPSDVRSALFGTRIMDDFFQVSVGGDVAFLNGVLKHLIESAGVDDAFIQRHTTGFDELRAHLAVQPWAELERAAGQTREDMARFARQYAAAKTCVLVYSMGLTQHRFGVENVKAVVNLALARGMLGREKCGVLPIRGHSGVQGGGECGVDPDKYPGGFEVANAEDRARFEGLWRHSLPAWKGHRTLQMLEAAHRGEIDFLYSLGGNLLETLPDRSYMLEALGRVKLRIHQDIVLNTSSVLEGSAVLLLPAQTRYESPGGGTATSTERRIRFSPEIPGPRIAEARPEWEIPIEVARAARPGLAGALETPRAADIRREMALAIPIYAGVEQLEREGQWVQWGGERLFADGFTRMPGGRARFTTLSIQETVIPEGRFHLTTRRGKQFNSITYGERDFLTGSRDRRDVLVNPSDADRLGIADGQEILLRSEVGEWIGIAKRGPIKERHLQAHWPEANVLISRRFDPISGEPDYNAIVSAEPLPAGANGSRGKSAAGAAGAALALMLAATVACASIATGATPRAPARSRTAAHRPARAALPPDTTGMAAAAAAIDFTEYQGLLNEYLKVVSKPGEPLETRFDYIKLYENPGRAERFAGIHKSLVEVTPSKLTPTQRHAWAIDAYNFLVIELGTENFIFRRVPLDYRAKAIFGIPQKSLKYIKLDGVPFFEVPVAQVEGKSYNLNTFERTFVFDGYPVPASGTKPPPRPGTLDPRAHFALVCGAIGCPPLQPRAFLPESLDVQLDAACRGAMTNPRHLRWNAELQRLAASSVFTWYENDFGGKAAAFEFVKRYAPDSLHAALASKPQPVIDTDIPWDWDLNWVPPPPHKRPETPPQNRP